MQYLHMNRYNYIKLPPLFVLSEVPCETKISLRLRKFREKLGNIKFFGVHPDLGVTHMLE